MDGFPTIKELKSVTDGEEKVRRVRGRRKNLKDHDEKERRDGEGSRKRHHRKRSIEPSRDKENQDENPTKHRKHKHVDDNQQTKDKSEIRDQPSRHTRHGHKHDDEDQATKDARPEIREHPSRHTHGRRHHEKDNEDPNAQSEMSVMKPSESDIKDEKHHRHRSKKKKKETTRDPNVVDAVAPNEETPLKKVDHKPKIIKKPAVQTKAKKKSAVFATKKKIVKAKEPPPIDSVVKPRIEAQVPNKARVKVVRRMTIGRPINPSDSSSSDRSPENYDKERDDEWLGTEREKVLRNTVLRRHTIVLTKSLKLEAGCAEFMDRMKYFWWWLRLGGRMPFVTYKKGKIVKFRINKWSITFLYFALTSFFLTFWTTTMAYSLIKIFSNSSNSAESEINLEVERLEVDKYWVYALVTLITCTISSSVSLASIFDDGYILADFLTRWNLAISTMKYRPVRGLRRHFWINAGAFLIYATVLIILFFMDSRSPYHVPAVRGASGLIGTMIFLPFSPGIRFSPYFDYLEGFGLFVHLYSAYSSKVVLLMATMYCKALVNMSKRWNLRLAHVLGTLHRDMKTQKTIAVISYQKLFLEQTVIVGFLRHTGRIFAVGLGIFYTLKMAELTVLGYRVMSYFIFPLPVFNETIVPGTPEYLPPISYTDPPAYLVGTSIVMLLLNLTEWFITTRLIANCGDSILDGYSFVRRFGLILSKTSHRRRFVQSLNHAFSHATEYYIKSTFTINRKFISDTFFWLISILALLTAFSPFQLQRDVVTVCSADGNCVMVQRARVAWRSAGSGSSKEQVAAQADAEIKIIEAAITTDFPITEERTTEIVTTKTAMVTTTTTPTATMSTPRTTPTTITTMPTTATTMPTTTTTLTLTTATPMKTPTTPTTTRTTTPIPGSHFCRDDKGRQLEFPNICKDGKAYPPYKMGENCPRSSTDSQIPFDLGFSRVVNCKTKMPLTKGKRDDCQNIPLPDLRNRGLATMVPVRFDNGPSNPSFVLCCYDYGISGPNRPQQLKRCNQISSTSATANCKKPGTDRQRKPYLFDDLDPWMQKCIPNIELGKPDPNCQKVIKCLCDEPIPSTLKIPKNLGRKKSDLKKFVDMFMFKDVSDKISCK